MCAPSFSVPGAEKLQSCCPQGLRVICSAKTARNLTTTPKGPKGKNFGRKTFGCLFFLQGLGRNLGQSTNIQYTHVYYATRIDTPLISLRITSIIID